MSRDVNNKYWDEELETLPREELEKRQLADLKEIVQFAYDHAPYYRRSFDAAGVKPSDIKTLKDIQKFPFIDKKTQRDTQGVGSFLGELAAVPEEDVVFVSTSSGSTGELGGSIEATRKAIEDLWGAEVYDFYELSDIFGACAAMCEAKDGLHIAENHILVETVDIHTGEVLEPGKVGELVFTTLRKHARPLIRFRTGDIGWIDNTPCSCGRTHGRIHISGRKDDMFIVSAVNVFPSDIEAVIRELSGITGEYLIRVFERDFTCKYSVEIEKNSDNPATDEAVAAEVSAALKARIGVKPYSVVVHPDGGLNTRSEHKAKRIIDERKLDYSI